MKKNSRHSKYYWAYLAIAVFYCREFFLLGKVLCEAPAGDEFRTYYPSVTYFLNWVRQGVFPLWNSLSMGGHPFGMHSVSLFDLYHVFSVLFGVNAGYSIAVFFGVLLNGFFMHRFLAGRGVSHFGSFVGGLIWMITSGKDTETGFFFLPLSLWLADQYLRSKRHTFYTAFVFSLALYALNSNPQYFVYGCVLILSYMFYCQFQESRCSRLGPYGMILGAFFLAVFLAMIHYARFIELVFLSNRSSFRVLEMLLPTHYATAIFPALYECPARPELSFIVPTLLQKVFSSAPALKEIQRFIAVPYAGILPMIAAAACLFVKRKSFLARYFSICAWAVLAYLTLHPLFYFLFEQHIPFVKGMFAVSRFFRVYLFCLSVLAAVGIDFLRQRSDEALVVFSKVRRVFLSCVVALFLLMAGCLMAVHLFHDAIAAAVKRSLYFEPNFVNIQAASLVDHQSQRLRELFYFFDHVIWPKNPYLIWPLLILVAALGLVYFYQKKIIRQNLFHFLILSMMTVDLMGFYGFSSRSSYETEFTRYSGLSHRIQRDTNLYRVMMVEDSHTPYLKLPFSPESNMTYGIATPDGLEQLYNRRYVRFYSLLTKRKEEATIYLHPTSDFDENLTRFFNCRYVLTSKENNRFEHDDHYEEMLSDSAHRLYRNRDALPRVFVARDYIRCRNEEEAAKALSVLPRLPAERVVIEDGLAAEPTPTFGIDLSRDTLRVRPLGPHAVEIDADLSNDGYLVMSDVYYPGWRAMVDSVEKPIRFANIAFRAVWVEKGKHRVRFFYEPTSMKIGIALSLLALLTVVAVHLKKGHLLRN